MDLLISMVSMVKDINSIDRQYRNLNLQLKYAIDKAKHTLNKYKQNDRVAFIIKNLLEITKRGQLLAKSLDELLNAQAIAIKDKIRLSLPFNQTKQDVIFVIEALQKYLNDILVYDEEESKAQNKDGGVKRKVEVQDENKNNNIKASKISLTVPENDQQESQVLMGATIQQDEPIYSQSHKKSRQVQFKITIQGEESVIALLQKQQPNLLQTIVKLDESSFDTCNQIILYTVARLNFQKCYRQLKQVTKDIDRISTKNHFHIVAKKLNDCYHTPHHEEHYQKQDIKLKQQLTTPISIQGNLKQSGDKKAIKIRQSGSQKQQQQFFSFPTQKHGSHMPFVLFARKQDASKVLYQKKGPAWIKIQEEEKEILNGEKLAAFINLQTKQPSIYFQVEYKIDGII